MSTSQWLLLTCAIAVCVVAVCAACTLALAFWSAYLDRQHRQRAQRIIDEWERNVERIKREAGNG